MAEDTYTVTMTSSKDGTMKSSSSLKNSRRCGHNLPPPHTRAFAENHDLAVSYTLCELLQAEGLPGAHLPLAAGGLGLVSASCTSSSAYWASWADTLLTLHKQAPHLSHA